MLAFVLVFLTECESVTNLTFVNQMFTLELAENALTLQSVLSVFTRKLERETQFSPIAMSQYGLAQDRRFPNESVEKGSCAKQTCVVTTEVKATEIGVDLSHCWVPC